MHIPWASARFLLLIATLLLVAGRCCFAVTSFSSGTQTGTIQNSLVNEASGIAASRMNSNVLWTHNDSGDGAFLYAFNSSGTKLGTWKLTGATWRIWSTIR